MEKGISRRVVIKIAILIGLVMIFPQLNGCLGSLGKPIGGLPGCGKESKEISEINISGPSKTEVSTSVQFSAYTEITGDVPRTSEELAEDENPKNFTWGVEDLEESNGARIDSKGLFVATKIGKYKVTAFYTGTDKYDETWVTVTKKTNNSTEKNKDKQPGKPSKEHDVHLGNDC